MFASKKSGTGSETQFPGKLHDMMKFVQDHGLEDTIISWELNGYGFKINDPERLVDILPLFFGQTKYRSFRRQLNMWHFHRILKDGTNSKHNSSNNGGIFVHPYFVRHNRALCAQMSRHIPFKPSPEKVQEYIAMASCIVEPDPIRETPSASPRGTLDTQVSPNNDAFMCRPNIETTGSSSSNDPIDDGFFQLSEFRLPASAERSIASLPPLPALSNNQGHHLQSQPSKSKSSSPTSSLDAVLKTIEDVNKTLEGLVENSSLRRRTAHAEQEDDLMKMAEDLDDGLGSYEGMNFFISEI